MNKQKILLLLVLLTWLVWNTNISNASSFENSILKERPCIEKNEQRKFFLKNKILNKDNELIDNLDLINTILDKQIQNFVFEKLENKITLTQFKKNIKKNLQKRRKIHKILIELYNNNLTNINYLQAISKNWIKITNTIKIRDFFFSKFSA